MNKIFNFFKKLITTTDPEYFEYGSLKIDDDDFDNHNKLWEILKKYDMERYIGKNGKEFYFKKDKYENLQSDDKISLDSDLADYIEKNC